MGRGIKRKPEFEDSGPVLKNALDHDYDESRSNEAVEKNTTYSKPLQERGDEINFTLSPQANANQTIPPLDKPLLRTSGRLKISQLKKYILKKLKVQVEP